MNKKRLTKIFFRVLTIVFVAIAIGVGGFALNQFKPWLSFEKKVEIISDRTGLTVDQIEDMTSGCVGLVEPSCARAPVVFGRKISIVMGSVNSIGGKWGGSHARIETTLSGATVEPTEIKNWGSSISQQPFKLVDIKMRLTLASSNQPIHEDYFTSVEMDAVYPRLSASNQFKEEIEKYSRSFILFPVTAQEYELLKYAHVSFGDVLGTLFFVLLILFLAFVFHLFTIDVQKKPVKAIRSGPRSR